MDRTMRLTFTEAGRAALALTEAVTRLNAGETE
jgi:hypothetical protein